MAMAPGFRFSQFEAKGGYSSGMLVARNIYSVDKVMPIIGLSHFSYPDNEKWFKQRGFSYLLKSNTGKEFLFREIMRAIDPPNGPRAKIFIVHGHDRELLLELKNFLQNILKLGEPIILSEQPSNSMTVIEKFEHYSDPVTIVFVLMTPDDLACKVGEKMNAKRARQNVIFELGYFYGKLSRRQGRVILLYKGELELPSDIDGVIYVDVTNGIAAAEEQIRRELGEWL